MAEFSTATGALCAQHGDRTATGTCDRCGNFMCDECSVNRSSPICPACRALTGGSTGFPLSRDNWTFDKLWSYSWEAFKRDWVMLSVAALVVFGSTMMLNMMSSGIQTVLGENKAAAGLTAIVFQVISTLLGGVLQMGLIRMTLDVLHGGKADLAKLGSQVNKVGRYVLQLLLIIVAIGIPLGVYFVVLGAIGVGLSGGGGLDFEQLGSNGTVIGVLVVGFLIVLVPLMYFTLPLYFVTMELVFNDNASALQAFKNSYVIAKGNRLSILGIGLLTGLIAIVGILACCIGILPAMALGQLLLIGLFLTLRNGSGLPGGTGPQR
jgi:hypothetical protein